MRRMLMAGLTLVAAVLFIATPASAATVTRAEGGWVPAPQGAFDVPAGARCDFPVHSEPIVDEVQKLVLDTYPDGSPKRELYAGDLILQLTNTDTGATTQADASGTAMVEYHTDGSMTWYVVGPVLLGFKENGGNLPRGLWIIDGVFTVEFSPTFYKTVTMIHGTTHNLCTDLD